jgi:phosphatidylglycerophosphatase C
VRAATGARLLALFDLDGTLTRHDTLAQYLTGYLRSHPQRWQRVPAALPSLARYALGQIDRGALKSRWIAAVLGGCTHTQIDAWTADFVPRVIARDMFVQARAVLEAHRRRGDYLALLSASPDLYVPAIGRALGFDETLCTGVEWLNGRLTGRLTTPNRRGAEKERCLAALRARHPHMPMVAYANSASDLGHLSLAERAVLVNGSSRARRQARQLGISCASWR